MQSSLSRKSSRTAGFTLVELAIVLTILGLLAGGILAGQVLIHSAELRSVLKENEQYQVAVNSFKEKYFGLPGDLANATQFWGRADNGSFSGQCAAPLTNTGSGKQTCNGNGDGLVYDAAGTVYERYRIWQHLSNAGLIIGSYTGVASGGGVVVGVNIPQSKSDAAGWDILIAGETGSAIIPQATYNNTLTLGVPNGSSFTAEDVWSIDSKVDDAKPMTGNVLVYKHNACTSSAGNPNSLNAVYDLDNTNILCNIIFNNAF